MKNLENLCHQKLNQKIGKSKRYLSAQNVNVSNMGNHVKGVLKRPILQKSKPRHDVSHRHYIHRGQSHTQLQDEEDNHEQEHETMESFSPHLVRGRRLAESKRKHDVSHLHSVNRGQSHSQLQDEEDNHEQEHETMESFSPRLVRGRWLADSSVKITNPYEEEYEEEDEHEVDSLQTELETSDVQQDENIGSISHGMAGTRKESRALTQTRKRRLSNGKLLFEVDECMRRIVGDDSQLFITKGGCVMREHALFDGTTWKKQSSLLKADIITKCTENSTFDPNSGMMVHAIDTQLANQHRNKQHRLHKYYKTFPTKEEALTHPPKGIKVSEWVNLCERFTSQDFQKISVRNMKNRSFNKVPPAVGTVSIARIVHMKKKQGEEVSEIENYKIAHFSKKRNKMVNEEAEEILNDLQAEEATSSCTPAEICLKKLHRIPGHTNGRTVSMKENLTTAGLRVALELEKEKSKALEEKVQMIEEGQLRFQEEQIKFQEEQMKFQEKQIQMQEEHGQMKERMEFMMKELSRLSRLQSKKTA